MLGYFFQVFFLCVCEKKTQPCSSDFFGIFFSKKRKKKVEKIFHSCTMNIHGFFFSSFYFFFFKKKTTHVLRHAWFFSNFFSSFDIFQACSSDVHVFQACSSDYQLINALSRKKVVWSSWLFLCTTHCFLEIRTCFDVSYFNSELRKNAEKLDCS